MYYVDNYKYKNKYELIDKMEIIDLDGFMMGSKNKIYKINGCNIRGIKVINKKLASSLVTEKVMKKYNRLINNLTELLVDDDPTGENCGLILDEIEKFRLEIKVKYRKFLKQKELEMMSKQLITLQKETNKKSMEIKTSIYKYQEENRRSK